MSFEVTSEDGQFVARLRIHPTDDLFRWRMGELCRLNEVRVPFGIAVEVKTLYVLLLLAHGFFNHMVIKNVLTTSRTLSGGALIITDVWSVALNQDMMDEVLYQVYGET